MSLNKVKLTLGTFESIVVIALICHVALIESVHVYTARISSDLVAVLPNKLVKEVIVNIFHELPTRER